MDSLGVSLANTVNDFHQNMPCTDMDDIALSLRYVTLKQTKYINPTLAINQLTKLMQKLLE